jgi:hypothetical protein
MHSASPRTARTDAEKMAIAAWLAQSPSHRSGIRNTAAGNMQPSSSSHVKASAAPAAAMPHRAVAPRQRSSQDGHRDDGMEGGEGQGEVELAEPDVTWIQNNLGGGAMRAVPRPPPGGRLCLRAPVANPQYANHVYVPLSARDKLLSTPRQSTTPAESASAATPDDALIPALPLPSKHAQTERCSKPQPVATRSDASLEAVRSAVQELLLAVKPRRRTAV